MNPAPIRLYVSLRVLSMESTAVSIPVREVMPMAMMAIVSADLSLLDDMALKAMSIFILNLLFITFSHAIML